MKAKQSYADLLPPLSTEELTALKADIKAHGVRVPVDVTEDGTVLDGHHRLKIDPKAPKRVVKGLSEGEKEAYAYRANLVRRNLSPEQRGHVRKAMKATASKLCDEGKTQAAIGVLLGVDHSTVSRWLDINNVQMHKANNNKPKRETDRRVKLSGVDEIAIVKQVRAGEPQSQVAADFGVSQGRVSQIAKRHEAKQQKLADLKTPKPTAKSTAADWRIIHGDCLEQLAKLERGSVRLVFADPPYNIGIDYGKGKRADQLPEEEYLAWCRRWIKASVRVLSDDGSLWVMIGDEYADHFGMMLRASKLHRRNWVKWHETFGVNCTGKFNRCSRHIFYAVKDEKRFVFNADAVSRKSDRQTKYNDKRANPDGKLWDDVWNIPRLVGTAKERIPEFPTQLPLELTRAIVGCASNPDDLVVDPFSGSGSTGVAAIESGRRFIGIEKSRKFAGLSRARLEKVQ